MHHIDEHPNATAVFELVSAHRNTLQSRSAQQAHTNVTKKSEPGLNVMMSSALQIVSRRSSLTYELPGDLIVKDGRIW